MRVLFVNPMRPYPIEENYNRGLKFSNGFSIPLVMGYCASLLRKKHEVKIIDANLQRLDASAVLEEVKEYRPDAVFLSPNNFSRWQCPSFSIDWLVPVAEKIKKFNNEISTAVYGAHATITPGEVLEKIPSLDIAVRGEPEAVIVELAEALEKNKSLDGMPGISTRIGGKIFHNRDAELVKDLDSLPFPAYDLLPMEDYKKRFNETGKSNFIMLSSRGCPFPCVFCFKHVFGDRSYRERSPENVLDEAELLMEEYSAEKISFADWEFCLNKNRVLKICEGIHQRNMEFTWTINTRFPDIDDFNFLKTMKEAGLAELKLGFESGSPRILENIKKGIDLEKIPRIINNINKLGLKAFYYGIICSPGESLETLRESVRYSVKHGIGKGGGKITVPYPGTELHAMAEKQFGRKITWDDLPEISGRVGTDILEKHSVEGVYRRIYLYYLIEKLKKKLKLI